MSNLSNTIHTKADRALILSLEESVPYQSLNRSLYLYSKYSKILISLISAFRLLLALSLDYYDT